MNRNVSIAAGAGFSLGGFFVGQVARFLYSLVVARLLGADALGIYALAIAVVQIAEVAAMAGLDSALLRFVPAARHDPVRRTELIGSVVKMALWLSIAIFLLLELFSAPVAAALHGGRLLQLAVACYAAAIPFNVASMLYGNAMQACGNIRPKIIATQALNPILLLFFTLLFSMAFGSEAALLFPFALSAVISYFWIRPRLFPVAGMLPEVGWNGAVERPVLFYALPFMAVSFISMSMHWLDVMMLGMLTDPATVGLYHPAARTAGLIRAVLVAFAGMAAPVFAELHAAGRMEEAGRVYRLLSRWVLTLAIPLLLLFALLPGPVMAVFGSSFSKAAPALVLLSGAALLQAFFGMAATLLAMTGHARLSLMNAAAALLLQLLLNLILIPRMGIEGAALGSLLLFLTLSVARLLEVRSLLGLHPFSKALFKPLAAGAGSALGFFFLPPVFYTLPGALLPAAALCVLGLSYAVILLLLGLEEDEREIILQFRSLLGRKG